MILIIYFDFLPYFVPGNLLIVNKYIPEKIISWQPKQTKYPQSVIDRFSVPS